MSNSKFTGLLIAAMLLMVPFLGTSLIYGQEATEQFIPIGHSPGISDKYSFIGKIIDVDQEAHTIVVDSNRGERMIRVTPTTRIWLDRSKQKRTNTVGSYSDCEVGRKVEVMQEHDNESVADWIKIESG